MRDARGVEVAPRAGPARIACLYPSGTETLYDLGLADRLVARTVYCPAPPGARGVPTAGGTKNPDLERLRAAAPDLVIANRDENRREDVEAIETFCPVFVTDPRRVADVPATILDLGRVAGAAERVASALADRIRAAMNRCQRDTGARPRALAFIWRDPWWSFGGDTYASDLLKHCGYENVFARGPLRYFPLDPALIAASRPDLLLFPDEPYRFNASHADDFFRQFPGFRDLPFRLFDGSFLTWHGSRTHRALEMLPELLA
ncbi:MAG: ABC transporter substrate-binding protein [Planctomycetes bacterium]|nr:ABC transporter substrate-binding protein [Planctomycetota bacterium]